MAARFQPPHFYPTAREASLNSSLLPSQVPLCHLTPLCHLIQPGALSWPIFFPDSALGLVVIGERWEDNGVLLLQTPTRAQV